MKRFLFCCFFLVGSIALFSGYAAAETVELVTLQYPPYEYEENGEVKGLAVEVLKEAFTRMNLPMHVSLLPWARALDYVKEGKADAIFTCYKTPEREEFLDFSKEVLMPQIVSLFVVKDSPIVFDGDLTKMAKYKFGVVSKVSYGKAFDEAAKNGVLPNVEDVSTGELNMLKLLKNRVDILVSNKYGAWDILKTMGKADAVKELTPELQNIPSYIAFSKKKNLSAMRDKLDTILLQIRNDGTFDKIMKSYLK